MGDLHGDMIQGTKLMTDLGIISHQPNYYKDMLAKWARQDQVRAAKGLTPRKRRSAYAKDGVSNELQAQDIAANMLFNKRGDLMGGATADEFHWAGGKLLLVILGDAMNVGPDDIAILQFLRRLTREAAENKGKLVFLLGNHEMNNLKGNYLGVHPWSFEGSGGEEGRKRLLSTATRLGRFVRSSPGIFYYDHLMFMHGGLMPETVRLVERLTGHHNMTGKEFAKTVNMHVKTQLFDHENDPATIDSDEIAATVTNVDYEANGKSGILLVHPLDKCTEVEEANQLTLLQAQVVGHTPHTLPNYKFCDGSLYAMDFMLSKWKGGRDTPMAALEFTRVAIATPLGTAAPGNTSGSSDDQPKLIESSYKWSAKLLIPKAQPLDVLQEVHRISRLWFAVFVVIGVVVVEGLVVLTRHVLRLRKANSQFL
eukprot:GILI01026171.1.p1 GENE.GILI01026171.1~~GILI01026171.1.p1  ORF type:complete len:438 (+),score=77.41 GILI01026171.1:42-1316(+)